MDGWDRLIAAAGSPTRRLREAMADPAGAQGKLLRGILAANAATTFGRRHGLAAIVDGRDYARCVPICCFDDLRGAIGAMAAGEAGVLTAEPVIAFERTGGTASGGKLIPCTATSLAAFREAVLPWLADLARRVPAIRLGRAYVSISPVLRPPERTPGGIPIGLASDAAYLGSDLAEAFASLLAVSPGVALLADVETWRLETLAQLIEADDLAFVSVWSPTFFLGLVEAIPHLADALLPRLDRPARKRLGAALAGAGFTPARLWPRLAAISCWADGASRAYAGRLAALFPDAVLDAKGLLATEAAISLPFGSGAGCAPALGSTYLEFVAGDGMSLGVGELERGISYRTVVTTWGGLYRYDMGDVVRCVGHEGSCPRLVFEGRAALRSDLVGEKLDEPFVAAVLASLPVAAVLAARMLPRPHYELRLDPAANGEAAENWVAHVEAGLCRNPQYAYARRIGQLGALQVSWRPGLVEARTAEWLRQGKRLGDLKPVALLPDSGAVADA